MDELKYPEANVTSINLTMLKGGVANNVIPAELSATFDIRISINDDVDEFEQKVCVYLLYISCCNHYIKMMKYTPIKVESMVPRGWRKY